ncbi:MAG: hypothetical protein FOGNACKC_04319 [Anaerolineae bacterium]|nr:hypothetical protein [Anaerolineae bacterium]
MNIEFKRLTEVEKLEIKKYNGACNTRKET